MHPVQYWQKKLEVDNRNKDNEMQIILVGSIKQTALLSIGTIYEASKYKFI